MTKKNAQFKEGETVVYPKHGVGEVIKIETMEVASIKTNFCLLYTSPSPRDTERSRMPSSA